MNSQLKRTIDQVKALLVQDHDSVVYGQLHSGLGYTLPSDCPHMRPYYDFLGMSNGARCGVIDLWSYEELDKKQYRLTNWVSDVSDWLEVGQILYEPLVINRKSGLLYLLKEEEHIKGEENIGDWNDFLFNYVFGDKYNSIATGVDDWWLLLKRLQYV